MNLLNQLIEATNSGDVSLVESLLAQGAPINGIDRLGNGILHLSILNKHRAVTKFLLEKDILVDLPNKNGNTALHFAALSEIHIRTITLLLEKGAKLDIKNAQGKTPLHHSLERGASKIVCILLQAGAYSYPQPKEIEEMLESQWQCQSIHSEHKNTKAFYTKLMLAGVSTNGNILPKPLNIVQNNIISTVANWLKPLPLSKKEHFVIAPAVLRALPQINQWLKLLDDPKANELGHYYFNKATRDQKNEKLLNAINARIPEEIIGLIEQAFDQEALIGILVNKLVSIYSLSEEVAEYLLRDGIKHREEYSTYPKKLFEHDWETPYPPPVLQKISTPIITSSLQKFRFS